MFVSLRSLIRRRPAHRQARRGSFTQRLMRWANTHHERRWAFKPLVGAAAALLMGHAMAAPGRFTLPEPLQGTRTIRGKTYTFQPAGQNSVLGPKVEFRDAQGQLRSVSMKLVQTRRAGVYNWSSFDLGSASTFEIDMQAGAGSSALNRVVGSAKLSEIYGQIKSNGNVFLINSNGVLFGQGAQVNVQGLVASTLNVSDEVFLNGLSTIDTNTATFRWQNLSDDDLVTFDHPSNYVLVDEGATIRTPAGGRVWLMARKVTNKGTLSTQDGQVALLGGEAVYVKSPLQEPAVYASEVNSNLPVLRGFLFEVDNAGGQVSNLGQILSEQGNTTLMAHTVRQGGYISATTSVQANGSVFLLARSGVNTDVQAQSAGNLTLEAGSRVEILTDNAQTASGSVQMTMSRIELNGQQIVMEGERNGLAGAQVRAPAANVNVRAESSPNYVAVEGTKDSSGVVTPNPAYQLTVPGNGRFVMGAGAKIDVSGTTDSEVSVARHFVKTELIKSDALASHPFLKDGALFGSKVTYDTRSAPAVLEPATHQGYKDSIQTSAGERMAKGGRVNLVATGAVLMQAGSTVDVSGGQVRFTQAEVNPTRLLGADGQIYSVNNARTDVQVVAVSGNPQIDATRFGAVTPPIASTSRVEAGYAQGGDGGRLVVHAPTMVLDGQVHANVLQGQRQAAGVDTRAAQASVRLGLSTQGSLLKGLSIRLPSPSVTPAELWMNPLHAAVPERSSVSADWFNASGAGEITVAAVGGVRVDNGADLRLQRAGRLTVQAAGAEGVYLGGDISGAGASVAVSTASVQSAGFTQAGGITLAQGRRIDVAGDVVNQRRDGVQAGSAVAGGSVSLRSAAGLDLQDGTVIDASGGATINSSMGIQGSRAGEISLVANTEASARARQFGEVNLGATLRAHALTGSLGRAFNDLGDARSGKLTLKVGEIDIVGAEAPALKKGAAADAFVLGSRFFNQGGFTQFDLEGVRRMTVSANAQILPQVARWQAQASLLNAARGSSLSAHAKAQVLPDSLAPTRSLWLRSSGYADNDSLATNALNGALTLTAGSLIDAGPRGTVTLTGGKSLVVDGAVRAAGGAITTELVGLDSNVSVDSRVQGTYRFGSTAVLDVSGTTVLAASNVGGQRVGQVLAGGRITLQAPSSLGATTPIEFEQVAGADGGVQQPRLLANGAQSTLDVQTLQAGGVVRTRRSAVASDGGHITINMGAAGGAVSTDLQAQAGGSGAQGGALSLSISDGGSTILSEVSLQVQQAPVSGATPPGVMQVSADAIQSGGFAHIKLASTDEIAAVGDLSLMVGGDMTLDAPTLSVRHGGSALWKAAGRLARTNTQLTAPAAVTGGTGRMTLQAGLLDISGTHTTQGAQQLTLKAREEIRFHALSAQRRSGHLDTGASTVVLDTPQVNVATAADYAVTLSGDGVKSLIIQGGQADAPMPLSAGGRLRLKADEITVDGVLRAPFGQIELQAPSITLTEHAQVSVSGEGLNVPYGMTADAGTKWLLNGVEVSAPPAKTITLQAGDGALNIAAGASLDLSAGGQLLGWEFVPGAGGSRDVFNGTYESGTFAVVPSVKGLGGIDPDLLALSGLNDSVLDTVASRQITFGDGGPVPAGTYAILPARYALLQGAYLVKHANTSIPLPVGQALALNNGAVRVGAQVGRLGDALPMAPATTFEVLTREQALRFSGIRTTTFDGLVNARAERDGVAPARRAMDAGALDLAAKRINLEGELAFRRVQGGRGGELNVASNKIQVGGSLAPSVTDTLLLDVGQLNRTAVDSLLIGGRRAGLAADGSRLAQVSASAVEVANNATQALTLGDVIVVGQQRVAIADGAVMRATPPAGATLQADDLTVQGDGALVRVSADATVQTRRTDGEGQPILRQQGDVSVGDGAVLQGRSLVIEGTRSTALSNTASLQTQALMLAADEVVIGASGPDSGASGAPVLRLGADLLAQLAQIDRLTLRAFGGVTLADGQDVSVKQALTLDTSELRQAAGGRNSIAAGSLGLINTTGRVGTAAAGTATLVLQATGQGGQDGHVWFRDGVTALQGTGQVDLKAEGSMVFASRRVVETMTVEQARPDGYAEAPGEGGAVRARSRALTSGLQAQADITVEAQSVTAAHASVGLLDAGTGDVVLAGRSEQAGDGAPVVVQAASGLGARITVQGASVVQGGTLQAQAGTVALRATSQNIRFTEGSRTEADGSAWAVDGVNVPLAAGLIKAQADVGDIVVAQDAVLSASAAAGVPGAEAGEVRLLAQQGKVSVEGDVRLLSDTGQRGGALQIDARSAPQLDNLAARLNASAVRAAQALGASPPRQNATHSLALHQRDGQSILLSAGQTLRAQHISLAADRPQDRDTGADILIRGQLDASGAQAGRIELSATGDVVLGQGDAAPAPAVLDASTAGAGQAGGDIRLASRDGVVRLQVDGLVRASGGAGAQGGQLTLRAGLREAGDIDPATGEGNVRVAAIEARVEGVRQITVQGEERVQVNALDATELTALKARSQAFQLNAASQNTLFKIINGQPISIARIQSAQLLESDHDLTLSSAWNLTALNRQPVGDQFVVQLSEDAPLDLAIRTSGQLNVQASLSGGFINAPLTATTTLNGALRVAPADLPVGDGSSISLVAGAELGSADVMGTVAGSNGSVRIGAPGGTAKVFVRSTTGDIRLAATGDIVLENDRATVYTTGHLPTPDEVPGALGFGQGNPTSTNLYHRDLITRREGSLAANTTRQQPFMLDGGSISLLAGGSVRTESVSVPSFVSDWTFHKSDRSASKSQAWWSRYDLFDMGVATFGGGDITARAGSDVVNTGFVTATSAYQDASGAVRRYGGGKVAVQADGNLVGLMSKVGGDEGRFTAGLNIEGNAERGAASLMYENTRMTVRAAQDVLVDLVTEAGLHEKGNGGNDTSRSFGISGLGREATLSLLAVSGDLRLNDVLQPGVDTNHAAAALLPADSLLAAPMGSILASRLNQMPQDQGARLNVLAGQNLQVGSVNVAAASRYGNGVIWVGNNEPVVSFLNGQGAKGTLVVAGLAESGRREPIRLVAQAGDVSLRAEVADATRIVAGRDVDLPSFLSQHQDGNDLTLIQSGRDVNMFNPTGRGVVRGPGDLLVVAGRDMNNRLAGGLETNGNRENGALPQGSAQVTVLAGVSPGTADYGLAESRYFHLLGGAGVADRPGDLYAQLLTLQSGQQLAPLGSAAAQNFQGLPFSEQLQQARALVGEAAFKQAVLSYLQGREGDPALGQARADILLGTLPQREQLAVLGQILAPTWQQRVPAEQQREVALAMAVQLAEMRGAAPEIAPERLSRPWGLDFEPDTAAPFLRAYVEKRTGVQGIDDAAALAQFSTLSAEHRLLFTNQVLQAELIASGSLAAQLPREAVEAKLDAYQRSTNALATVFPGSKPTSSLLMGSSSIKTQQNSDIAVFAPHGGMNVGQLSGAADPSTAAGLGIVTTSGGSISGVARDSIEVNQSRVFVVQEGDLLLWASTGNIDAGKGSKTVTGAPPPVFRIVNGQLQADTTGSFSGSGIATLDTNSRMYLFAPGGEINAGEAGIKASGRLKLETRVIKGRDDIKTPDKLPPPPEKGNAATSLGDLGQSATAAGPAPQDDGRKASGARRRRLLLDFLGFGDEVKDEDDEK